MATMQNTSTRSARWRTFNQNSIGTLVAAAETDVPAFGSADYLQAHGAFNAEVHEQALVTTPWTPVLAAVTGPLHQHRHGAAVAATPLRPRAMAAAVAELLQHARVRTFVLDDLHFADAASIELFSGLASAPETPLRWLFAQRPAEAPGAAQDLRGALGEEDEDRKFKRIFFSQGPPGKVLDHPLTRSLGLAAAG